MITCGRVRTKGQRPRDHHRFNVIKASQVPIVHRTMFYELIIELKRPTYLIFHNCMALKTKSQITRPILVISIGTYQGISIVQQYLIIPITYP